MKNKNKTLLIISNGYPNKSGNIPSHIFVKEQVDKLSNIFNKIIVISPTPYFPKLLNKLKLFPSNMRDKSQFNNYKYNNVKVYYPKFFTIPIEHFRKNNPDYAYKTVKKCIDKYQIKFNLIHAHFTLVSGYIGYKLKQKFNKKLIITLHRNQKAFKKEIDSSDIKVRKSLLCADKLIRVNKKDIPLLKTINKNTIHIPNGFDNNKFKEMSPYVKHILKIPMNKKILLHVGSYRIKHKNQINLIYAIKELLKVRQDIILYLVGSGEDEQKIKLKINELSLNNYIKVIGAKPHNEIPRWMNASDLFILPSYSESFGVVNIESLGCGTPVITTINGGSEEIITSNEYGYILEDPNDYKCLAKLINKGLKTKWNKNKIIKYAQKYNWDNIISKIIRCYK